MSGVTLVIGLVAVVIALPRAQSVGRDANPTAALFVEQCSGCHGTDLAGGRAPSLFTEQWLASTTDERIANAIRNGVPNTPMAPFKSLSDEQIWQLTQYMRTQSGVLKTRPAFVVNLDGAVVKSEKQTVRMEVVAKDLDTPWGIAFLPDGRMLVTERTVGGGQLRVVEKGVLLPPVKGTPRVHVQQDAGMFDVQVHPRYAENGWIYLSYAELLPGYTPPAAAAAGAGGRGGATAPSMTAIVRGRLKNNEWVDQQFIYHAPPAIYTTDGSHFGSRFIFGREGHLFYSIGDRGVMQNAQDLSSPLGKIHRVNDDGTIPRDNPFVKTPNAVASIWSYGHRNPQGLAWDPKTGKLWESEHGPQGGDEINVIEKGHNYGWGVITMGVDPRVTERTHEGMEQPIVYYTPTIAPSGMTFYTDSKYPQWKNSLFVSSLGGQQLRRLEIDGDKVTHQEQVFNQFGRVHDVIVGPDGYLYVTLQLPGQVLSASTPGMIARLIPVKQ